MTTITANGDLTLRDANGNVLHTIRVRVPGSAPPQPPQQKTPLADLVNPIIESWIADREPGSGMVYTDARPPDGSEDWAERNPDCWAAGLDLSCVSLHKPRGTLIASDVVLMAGHYNAPIDHVLYFQRNDGRIISRRYVAEGNVIPGIDLQIGILSGPIEFGVPYARIMPENWAEGEYVDGLFEQGGAEKIGVYAVSCDQERKALLTRLEWYNGDDRAFLVRPYKPTDAHALSFYEMPVVGDSGSPTFIPIPDSDGLLQPALVCLWQTPTAGPMPSEVYDAICDKITLLRQRAFDAGKIAEIQTDMPQLVDMSRVLRLEDAE